MWGTEVVIDGATVMMLWEGRVAIVRRGGHLCPSFLWLDAMGEMKLRLSIGRGAGASWFVAFDAMDCPAATALDELREMFAHPLVTYVAHLMYLMTGAW